MTGWRRSTPSSKLFLYRDVLRQDIGDIGQVIRAKQPVRLPVVLNREPGLQRGFDR